MTQAQEQTRDRLLTVARQVFSEVGFQNATVREICRRADANVAAVNYHFGSKDGLLAEALNFTQLKTLQTENAEADACPKVRLRLFIHAFLSMLLDDDHPSSPCQIMARELANPSPALDQIVRDALAPLHAFLDQLVHEIVGDAVTDMQRRCVVSSIFGQCVHYSHARPVLQRLHPELCYDAAEIAAIADHIATFSLAGMSGISLSVKK
ncbi:MAG: CerR family C-terminal domain-containing protein [Gallionella sp.]|nr:CerR family C-terminal domain-containing protein [Gallionella sp.]MDD4958472.1 CerR family C-terminal domain-containing protein [Gallionella sp.]